MKQLLRELVDAGRDVLRITFVEPVRDGRPHPKAWPSGLFQIATVVAGLMVTLVVLIFGSSWLRSHDVLVLSTTSPDIALPGAAVPILLMSIVVAFALAMTAALHTAWWLRLALLVLASTVVVLMNPMAFTSLAGATSVVGATVALVAFTLIRARRGYAWWEYIVVLGLLTMATLVPLSLGSALTATYDLRVAAIFNTVESLSLLILPVVAVAGFAPAQIVVTGADAIANRPVSRGLFWVVFAAGLAGVCFAAYQGFTSEPPPTWAEGLASLVALAVAAAAAGVLIWRSRVSRPPEPSQYPAAWNQWIYPVAVGLSSVLIVTWVIAALTLVLAMTQQAEAAGALQVGFQAAFSSNTGTYWRAVIGLLAGAIAWRLAGRGRVAEAIVLALFAVQVELNLLGLLPGFDFLLSRPTLLTGLIASALALIATGVLLVRRRFDRSRATGVLTVLMLVAMFPYRNALSDPISAVLAVAPTALLVVGLGWRMVTEANITYESTPRFPQSTRVLLFLGVSLLAITGIAVLTLARAMGTPVDTSIWGELGDIFLGEPLYQAGLIAALWLMLRVRLRGEHVAELTDEAYDPLAAAAAEAALEAQELAAELETPASGEVGGSFLWPPPPPPQYPHQ